jgi:anti-anti-sigma factor
VALGVEEAIEAARPGAPADRCAYPKPFAADFTGCSAFQAISFIAADSGNRRLGSWLTCRHLESGADPRQTGRFYPKCSLGDAGERRRWVARVRSERLEVVRALQEEFDRFSQSHRELLFAARAKALAEPADWQLRQDLDRLVADYRQAIASFLALREERFEDVGLPIAPLLELFHESSTAWSRQWGGTQVDDPRLRALSADSQALTGPAGEASWRTEPNSTETTIFDDGMLQIGRSDEQRTLALRGEIDLSNAERVSAALTQEAQRGGDLDLDLSGVLFCDLAGLRAILQASMGLADGHRLILQGMPAALHKTMEIAGWAPGPRLTIVPAAVPA